MVGLCIKDDESSSNQNRFANDDWKATMKLTIVFCSAVIFVAAKNADPTSNPRIKSWQQRVEASANDSFLQTRSRAAETEILKNIAKYKNYKPTIFGSSVYKISEKYGRAEIVDCMKPVTHEYSLIQENITKTETCVGQIEKGRLVRVEHGQVKEPWSFNHHNHLSLLPPGVDKDYNVTIDVFMDTYEQSLDTCITNFRFKSVGDNLKILFNVAGECIERHFEKYPTTCFDNKGFALDISLECFKLKLEIYSD